MATLVVESLAVALLILSISIPLIQQRTTIAQEVDSPFPLFSPKFFIHGESTPMQVFAGDNLELVMVLNNENNVSGNMTFMTQIINPSGTTEAIQLTTGTIYSGDETLTLIDYWKPERDSTYFVDTFLLESSREQLQPLSDKRTTDISVRSKHNDTVHDLRVELNLDHPSDIVAGQELKGFAELVNYASHPESVRIESDYNISVRPKGLNMTSPIIGDCIYWPGLELDEFVVLPGHGGRLKLIDGDELVPSTIDHEDSYELTWHGRFLVQEPNGADCYYLTSPPVIVNVTAPKYDDVRLVLESDKESYTYNEPVRFTIYVENNSDEPFRIDKDGISIRIKDMDGNNNLWFTAGLLPSHGGIPIVVVEPNSNYTFANVASEQQTNSFWTWDRRNITPEGIPFPMDPGNYQAYATFSSPPMRSKTISIVLSEKDDTKNVNST